MRMYPRDAVSFNERILLANPFPSCLPGLIAHDLMVTGRHDLVENPRSQTSPTVSERFSRQPRAGAETAGKGLFSVSSWRLAIYSTRKLKESYIDETRRGTQHGTAGRLRPR